MIRFPAADRRARQLMVIAPPGCPRARRLARGFIAIAPGAQHRLGALAATALEPRASLRARGHRTRRATCDHGGAPGLPNCLSQSTAHEDLRATAGISGTSG